MRKPYSLQFAPYVLGVVYIGLGLVMLLLEVASLVLRESPWGFLVGAMLSIGLGLVLRRLGNPAIEPSRSEALLSVALLWFTVPLLGAVPFWLAGNMSFLDAFFESMSGFTTTGATALTDFKQLDYTLFFYRSLIQWFGGVGLLVLLTAVLAHLAIAGRQLFMTESLLRHGCVRLAKAYLKSMLR
jgi:trk system potassium uptake protein